MPLEEKYTERDLKIAEEIAGLKTMLMSFGEKIDNFSSELNNQIKPVWERLDQHANKLTKQNGTIKWIIGVGTGVWAIFGLAMIFFKSYGKP